MVRIALNMAILALLSAALVACSAGGSNSNERVTVQHILISVSTGTQVTPFRVIKQIASQCQRNT